MKGLSSLLFIVSSMEAFITSDLIFWKIANVVLLASSLIYNMGYTTYNFHQYMLFDYLAIIFIVASYIDDIFFTIFSIMILAVEYSKYQNIIHTKNIIIIIGFITILYRTFINSTNQIQVLIFVGILGIVSFYIRNLMYYNKPINQTTFFSLIWHYCIVIILCIASYTAQSNQKHFTILNSTKKILLASGGIILFLYMVICHFNQNKIPIKSQYIYKY